MWERFSYYGMRALLVFYMGKGFLAYPDERAYAVYGAYTALVYATPFVGACSPIGCSARAARSCGAAC
jgi:POT family proton-dependent oligopeptide transporter